MVHQYQIFPNSNHCIASELNTKRITWFKNIFWSRFGVTQYEYQYNFVLYIPDQELKKVKQLIYKKSMPRYLKTKTHIL